MKTHAIHWQNLNNGTCGTSRILFERHEAEQLVEELNQDYPGILHKVVPVPPASIRAGNSSSGQSDAVPAVGV